MSPLPQRQRSSSDGCSTSAFIPRLSVTTWQDRDMPRREIDPSKQPPGPTTADAPATAGPRAREIARLPEGCRLLWEPPRSPEYLRLRRIDRKSTRLNSSHVAISYAVFCLIKKKRCASSG